MSNLCRSSYYYEASGYLEDGKIIELLEQLAQKHPTYGFWKMFHRLRNQGYQWNHKKVYRIYKTLNLNIKRK